MDQNKLNQLLNGGVGCRSDFTPIRYVNHDAITSFDRCYVDILIAEANCFNVIERGFATALTAKYPELAELDASSKKGDGGKLGTTLLHTVNEIDQKVGLMYTRYHCFGNEKQSGTKAVNRRFNSDAFRKAFKSLLAEFPHARIGMPMLGLDRGGAPWEEISGIIEQCCFDADVQIIVFRPKPMKKKQKPAVKVKSKKVPANV